MKSLFLLPLVLGLLFSTTSCYYWGPNQQAGTVIGGLAGAGLGAAIGSSYGDDHYHGHHGYYHRGGGNTAEGALIGAAVGALAGNLLGASADQRQYYEDRYYAPAYSGTPAPATTYAPAYGQLPPRHAGTTNVSIGFGYGGYYPYYGPRPYYGGHHHHGHRYRPYCRY